MMYFLGEIFIFVETFLYIKYTIILQFEKFFSSIPSDKYILLSFKNLFHSFFNQFYFYKGLLELLILLIKL